MRTGLLYFKMPVAYEQESVANSLPFTQSDLPHVVLFLFFAGLALFGCFILFAIAFLGDWSLLAGHFRARHRPKGPTFYFRSACVGSAGYRLMLTIVVSEEGLYLAVLFPFRFMHPPLLIPWSEITDVHESKLSSLSNYYLSIGHPEWASLVVYGDVLEAIRPHLKHTEEPQKSA